ncbi:hypothetical protein QWZ13_15710 [Reinekea marina]|nr:hypothetical protein [Reinekea marina]MDN3650353.1 hypothetical protein [Reinekea marina]
MISVCTLLSTLVRGGTFLHCTIAIIAPKSGKQKMTTYQNKRL